MSIVEKRNGVYYEDGWPVGTTPPGGASSKPLGGTPGDGQLLTPQPPPAGAVDYPNVNPNPDTTGLTGYTWDAVQGKYVQKPRSAADVSTYMNTVLGGLGVSLGSGGAGALPGTIQDANIGAPGSLPPVPRVNPADTKAANAATFGAAKDQAGQTARASITGLRENLAERGMLGSGAEEAGTRQATLKAGQDVNDVTRQNAVTDVNTENQLAVANMGAGVTQRGQDLTAQDQAYARVLAQRAQNITQRGQDISVTAAQAARNQQLIMGLLQSVGMY